MLASTLSLIRTECVTPQDLLELLGAVQWRYPATEPVGDSIGMLCGLIEADLDTQAPTLDDVSYLEDFRRRSAIDFDVTYGAKA